MKETLVGAASTSLFSEIDDLVHIQWHGRSQTGTRWSVYEGSAELVLSELPKESIHCVVTSPPYYWLRDYGVAGQIGLEETSKNT